MSRATNRGAFKVGTDKVSTEQILTAPLGGELLSIGGGFSAQSFKAQNIGPAMDPLVMIDHYVMTEDTFGTHPHAGLSAVSLILPDSKGRFHNRDSLGNDLDLLPGDLYWLKAGRGALHNEAPRQDSRIHGLQLFINVPQALRYEEPSSLLVRQQDMPVLANCQHKVRVAMGESNRIRGAKSPGLPITILDGQLSPNGSFEHEIKSGRNAWVHAIHSDIEVAILANKTRLQEGQAVAINNANNNESIIVRVAASKTSQAQFALLDGQAIKEPFVQQGPFVMGSKEEFESVNRAYARGHFGFID